VIPTARPPRALRRTLPVLLRLGAASLGAAPASADAEKALVYTENYYPTLDPAHHHPLRPNDERLLLALYEPLTRLDPATGKALPAAAERYEVGEDGRTWTFRLRQGARWSDGSPVTTADFLRAWRRVLDPFTQSEWASLFRPIAGAAAITDNNARMDGYSNLRKNLEEMIRQNPNGIPGGLLNGMLDESGVRPFLVGIRSRAVRNLKDWPDADLFTPEAVSKARDVLNEERKEVKEVYRSAFDAFGKPGSGLEAVDAHTLVVRTEGAIPWLPELVARAAFAPLHSCWESLRDKAFEQAGYVCNGPYLLKGRGAKPPEGLQSGQRVRSVVDLARNPHYVGPFAGKSDVVKCFTDQSRAEDILEYERKKVDWVLATWPEAPATNKDPAKNERARIEALPGYTVRETPSVLYLRFRCDRAPFKKREARKAFALALDRPALADLYWPKAAAATRLVPAGIQGRVEGVSAPGKDLAAAKQALEASGVDVAELWVELGYGEAPGQDAVARRLIRDWKKDLGVEPGEAIVTDDSLQTTLRAGKYYFMVQSIRGWVNDPYAYLAPFHGEDPDSGLGWRDDVFNALLDAARDPTAAAADPDAFARQVEQPGLASLLRSAQGSGEARENLRRELLAAAERRLLDEYVIVPLLDLRRAELVGGVKGLGEPEAWRNPAFVGALWNAQK